MSQSELLKQVATALDRHGIDYMVTGSMVSSMQGEPRATHDIDIVVKLCAEDVESLIEAFPPPNFYLNEKSMRDAVARQAMFNLIDTVEGDKVDFWMLTERPFDQSRFSRKHVDCVLGMDFNVSRPEDTILAKLEWGNRLGGSEKQFTDALRVYELQYQNLDFEYLNEWVSALSLENQWKRILDEAEIV